MAFQPIQRGRQAMANILGTGNTGLQPSPTRSALVEQLLAKAQNTPAQSKSFVESLNIASAPILAAILARREERGQQNQEDQQKAKLLEALGLNNMENTNSSGVAGAGVIPESSLDPATRAYGAGTPAGGTGGGGTAEQRQLAAIVAGMDPAGRQGALQLMAQNALTQQKQPETFTPLTDPQKQARGIPVVSYAEINNLTGGVRITHPPNSLVDLTIDNRPPSDEFKDLPPPLQDRVIDLTDRAGTSRRQASEMRVMRDMTAGADTGILTPVTLPIKQAFAAIGITLDEDVPLLEAIRSQQNQLALRMRNPASGFGLTGSTSDRDVRFLLAAVPGLANTPEGNQAIAIIMEAKMRRDADLQDLESNYIQEHRGYRGWTTARDKWIEENSLFTEDEQSFIESLSNPASQLEGYYDLSPEEQEELNERERRSRASTPVR